MRKLFKLILALAFVLCMVVPAQAATHDYWAQVYSWDGKITLDGKPVVTKVTSGITFKVLAVGTDTSETLTYYGASTSLTNPVTTTSYESATICNDRVAFRCDPTDATNDRDVDLIVVNTDGGYTAFVEDFSYYNHTIIIDQRPGMQHHGMIWFNASTGSATEIDTGIDFQLDTMIHDVRTETVTVDAAITIEVGLNGAGQTGDDPDGFIDARSVAAAGYTKDTAFITAGSSCDYYPVSTYGALLVTAITGTGEYAASTGQDNGGRTYLGHVICSAASANDLTYTLLTAANTAVGYIHYWFTRIR